MSALQIVERIEDSLKSTNAVVQRMDRILDYLLRRSGNANETH